MVRLTILVDDISSVIAVFSHIRLYYSTSEDGTYTHLVYVPLVAGVSTYTYNHTDGNNNTWYKSSYWSTVLESSLSDAVQGSVGELYHYPTYPEETPFSNEDVEIIRRIRRYIGDLKKMGRLYISNDETSCNYIHADQKTIDVGEKSWPVYITHSVSGSTAVEKTSTADPVVQGYRYLTFGSTLNSGIQNDVLDIWYYTFKFSDREVYEAYGDAMIPPGLSSDSVTQDHIVLQASIDLLENMTVEDMVDDGAAIRDGQSLYDPSPGLRERDKTIKRLQAMLDKLVKQYAFSNISGVLID